VYVPVWAGGQADAEDEEAEDEETEDLEAEEENEETEDEECQEEELENEEREEVSDDVDVDVKETEAEEVEDEVCEEVPEAEVDFDVSVGSVVIVRSFVFVGPSVFVGLLLPPVLVGSLLPSVLVGSPLVFVGLLPVFPPPVFKGYGSVQGPVQLGGFTGIGVIPPLMPTSSGRQSVIPPPKSRVQTLRELQLFLLPGGPVTVSLGEFDFGGRITTDDHVGAPVKGAVNV
jgi:hypothetical protein